LNALARAENACGMTLHTTNATSMEQ